MIQPITTLWTPGTPRRIDPADLTLPPTQPFDITSLIAAEASARSAGDPTG